MVFGDETVPAAHRAELDERGYLKLEGFFSPELRQRLLDRIEALFAAEGDRAGSEFKQEPGARRLANRCAPRCRRGFRPPSGRCAPSTIP